MKAVKHFNEPVITVCVRFDKNFIVIVQTAILLLRIDDIVSGTKKSEGREGTQSGAQPTNASMAE
jgi:hypothetical protein